MSSVIRIPVRMLYIVTQRSIYLCAVFSMQGLDTTGLWTEQSPTNVSWILVMYLPL